MKNMFTLKSLFKRFLKRKQVRQSPLEEINTMITSIKYHSPDSGSLILMFAVSLVFFYLAQIGYIPFSGQRPSATSVNTPASGIDKNLEAVVFPTKGITVAARWGDAIGKLVDAGVIDQDKFTATMEQDGTALTIEELAILGVVELMISQEASDNQIFEAAKAANAFWFPDSTLELAAYFQTIKNISWQKVSPVTAVSAEYASSQGAQKINQALQEQGTLPQARGGGSCGA